VASPVSVDVVVLGHGSGPQVVSSRQQPLPPLQGLPGARNKHSGSTIMHGPSMHSKSTLQHHPSLPLGSRHGSPDIWQPASVVVVIPGFEVVLGQGPGLQVASSSRQQPFPLSQGLPGAKKKHSGSTIMHGPSVHSKLSLQHPSLPANVVHGSIGDRQSSPLAGVMKNGAARRKLKWTFCSGKN